MRRGRSKRRLSKSLIQQLADPKIVTLRPGNRRRSSYSLPSLAQKIAFSVVTLIVILPAGGHLLRAW